MTRHSLAEAQAHIRLRVSLAENNAVNQKAAVRMLEKLGCRVDVVVNGLEVLQACLRIPFPYDCVFMVPHAGDGRL